MYGAIAGDIIGSRFEFDRGNKSREFKLFTEESCWTDDTVMTVAVAEALLDAGKNAAPEEIEKAVTRSMQKWGNRYPDAGYGVRFCGWLRSSDPQPYNSCGNGSGMRVSPVGWFYDSIERTREAARATAVPTHNHPEGIKGAESTAAAIFLARTGATKEEIKEYIEKEFGYDLSRTLDEIRPDYHHVEICQETMPEAFTCFLEAESFEDTIRNVMYIGGDTDTLGAIACAVAEAYFGEVPMLIMMNTMTRLEADMLEVITRFRKAVGLEEDQPENDENEEKNIMIREAAEKLLKANDKDKVTCLLELFDVFAHRIDEGGMVTAPVIDRNGAFNDPEPFEQAENNTLKLKKDARLVVEPVQNMDGTLWKPLFTDDDEVNKGSMSNIRMEVPVSTIISDAMCDGFEGLVINPFGFHLSIKKELLKVFADGYKKMHEE